MAFGALLGTLTVVSATTVNPTPAVGSVAVSVGDLIYVAIIEQTTLSATGVTDNLGNTYAACATDSDAGTATGVAYYARVTNAGTLTTVNVATSSGGRRNVVQVAVIEGPFATSPLDAAPANITNDITTPYTCPATGTLAQADEVVMCFVSSAPPRTLAATSPNVRAIIDTTLTIGLTVGYQVVSATTSVAPEWTGTAPTTDVLGTASFKKAATSTNGNASGGTLTITASLVGGTPSGQRQPTVSGVTLSTTASLTAGTASGVRSPTVSGATLTTTASLTAGTASGVRSPTVSGQTLTVTASLVAGTAGVTATVTGQVLTAVASLPVSAVATGERQPTVSGVTLSTTASLIAGTASGVRSPTVAGQVLTTAASLTAGTASGARSATVAGQVLTATTALTAGSATGDISGAASGVTLLAVASLIPGVALGVINTTTSGQTLTAVASVPVSGSATGTRSVMLPGVTLTVHASISAGIASSVSPPEAEIVPFAVGRIIPIQEPELNLESLVQVSKQLKEAIEMLQLQYTDARYVALQDPEPSLTMLVQTTRQMKEAVGFLQRRTRY